ncbi:metallophosphoesterase family protein [Runella sp.]|uniref:metallophosphoesterase family protein n=1 Tax=Runella sp. TaxID=1960881 RepID=UPI003D1251A1
MMDRRASLKNIGLAAATLSVKNVSTEVQAKKRILRIAHITDIHIRPEHDAPNRFRKCVDEIKKHKPDFFLNGGDTIYAADYQNITRERVNEQWMIWRNCRALLQGYEVYSCLGNHDMWWAAPSPQDEMYGKEHVVRQLEIPKRYYSFDKKGWHFIVLDSNNKSAGSLDDEQRTWLEADLAKLAANTPILVMSHYPLLAVCTHFDGGGMHTDFKYLANLFYQHKDKIKTCISGHIHLVDRVVYNDISYFCNGALSGFWWEEGDKNSAQKYYYLQTPPGYAIIDLYNDGSVENTYHPHSF